MKNNKIAPEITQKESEKSTFRNCEKFIITTSQKNKILVIHDNYRLTPLFHHKRL
jgi:hypothetical protein